MKKDNFSSSSGGLESMLDGLSSFGKKHNLQGRANKLGHMDITVANLFPSRFQPRKKFDSIEINNLASSVKKFGLINPITVRKVGDGDQYEIIAGERRWRAVQQLGWETIPANIKNISDKDAYAVALVENLQREDLNPIEEADGYLQLIEKYNFTHEQVAEYVGKPRSTISNFIRLLELDDAVQDLLKYRKIDIGHAKLLVSLSKNIQGDLANNVVNKSLSVRQLEALIKRTVFAANGPKLKPSVDDRFKDISVFLKRKLGEDFEVCISKSLPNRISFSSEESLLKFMELLA